MCCILAPPACRTNAAISRVTSWHWAKPEMGARRAPVQAMRASPRCPTTIQAQGGTRAARCAAVWKRAQQTPKRRAGHARHLQHARGQALAQQRAGHSLHWGLGPRPSVYKTDALPLSCRGTGTHHSVDCMAAQVLSILNSPQPSSRKSVSAAVYFRPPCI